MFSFKGHLGPSGSINTGIASFEMEYSHWLQEQSRRVSELRTALQSHISDIELKMLVESCLNHYANLFRMKSDAAKADVFYLISGMWRTSTERFFQWIGGFRPSELLNVKIPKMLQSLTKTFSKCNIFSFPFLVGCDALSSTINGSTNLGSEKPPTIITTSRGCSVSRDW